MLASSACAEGRSSILDRVFAVRPGFRLPDSDTARPYPVTAFRICSLSARPIGTPSYLCAIAALGLKSYPVRPTISSVSTAEIIARTSQAPLAERRRLAGAIFDLEAEAELLRDFDKRADERFGVLDAMETEDGSTSAG